MKTAFAVTLIAAVGCGSSGQPPGMTTQNDTFPPPAVGMQLKSTPLTLMPAEEQYTCWSFELDWNGPPLALVELGNKMATGVHHYAVFTNSAPRRQDGPYECSNMGPTWGLVSGGGVG